jgi:predicted HTH transcriptional regulator
MPTARAIFDDPDKYLSLLTASDDGVAERQFLDRKQAPVAVSNGSVLDRDLDRFLGQIIETVSAFANGNRDAGLLVVGISKHDAILGIDHLSERQRLRLSDFNGRLRNESCQVRSHPFVVENETRHVLFIYVPYAANAICETADNERRAWIRHDLQNILLTADRRSAVEREKGIADFENARCRPFIEDDIDRDVLAQFRQSFLHDPGAYNYGAIELLKRAGAIEREQIPTFPYFTCEKVGINVVDPLSFIYFSEGDGKEVCP